MWKKNRDIQISERSIDVLSISRHSFRVKARAQIVRHDATRCRRRTYDGRGKTDYRSRLDWSVWRICIFSGRSCLHLCTMHAACKHAGCIWMRIMCTYVYTWLSAKCSGSHVLLHVFSRACSRAKCSAMTTSKQWITGCYVPSTRRAFCFYRFLARVFLIWTQTDGLRSMFLLPNWKYFHFPRFDISSSLSLLPLKEIRTLPICAVFRTTSSDNSNKKRSFRSIDAINGNRYISANMTRVANWKIGERKKVSSRAQTLRCAFVQYARVHAWHVAALLVAEW